MKKKKTDGWFREQYEVKFDYQKHDGYWVFGNIETFIVPTDHGHNEKNNHDKARAVAQWELEKRGYRKLEITSVTYC